MKPRALLSAQPFALVALALGCASVACSSETEIATPGPAPSPTSTQTPETVLDDVRTLDGDWRWVRGRPLSLVGNRAGGEVVAIGAEGAFFRWAGRSWYAAPVPTKHTIVSAALGGRSTACVSDDAGDVFQLAGGVWKKTDPPAPAQKVLLGDGAACWAVVGGEAGAHGGSNGARLLRSDDQGNWTQPAPVYPYCLGGDYLVVDGVPWSAGLTCNAAGTVENAEVRRFVDGSWQLVGAPFEKQSWYPSLDRFEGRPAVNADGTFLWNGEGWIPRATPAYPQQVPAGHTPLADDVGYIMTPSALRCEAAYGTAAGDELCVGGGQVYVKGSAWHGTLPDPFSQTGAAGAWGEVPPTAWAGSDTIHAWGTSSANVYRARRSTSGLLEHFDGTTWQNAGIDGVIDIQGAGENDVWLATKRGPRHLEGNLFVEKPLPAGEVLQVHALGAGRAAASTSEAVFVTDAKGGWQSVYRAPVGFGVQSIAGSGPNDLWLVEAATGRSNEAHLMHFDGTRWTERRVEIGVLGARLGTFAGETWLANDTVVARLMGAPLVIPFGDRWLASERTLWVHGRTIWLSTATQARRGSF